MLFPRFYGDYRQEMKFLCSAFLIHETFYPSITIRLQMEKIMNEIIEKKNLKLSSLPEPSAAGKLLPVHIKVNGNDLVLHVEPWTTILDALREQLDLIGTKKGCDHGQCGACTVLADGKRINSCLALAVMYEGVEITTIEGLADGDTLHPLQEAFIEHDAFQCGYCTPGQICSAVGLLNEGKAESPDDVFELMSGNLCRCGAYSNIFSAIKHVMDENQKTKS